MSQQSSNNLSSPEQMSRLLRVAVMLGIAAIIATATSAFGIYLAFNKKPLVLSANDKGQLIQAVPLNQPYVTDSRVIAFAEECTRRSFSHDFENFRYTVMEASKCFSSAGTKQYTDAMDAMLKEVRDKRMIMTVSVDPPVIVVSEELDGRMTWVVQSKIRMFREGQRERVMPQSYVVTMRIVRVEIEESVRGIAINEFNAKPVSD